MTLEKKVRPDSAVVPAQNWPSRTEEKKENGLPNPPALESASYPEKLSIARSASQAAQKVEDEERESLWEATADPAFRLKE